jgi:transposase
MTKLINSDACGIDISTKEFVVAVPEDRDTESVRTFQTFTRDIHLLAKWLNKCGVKTIAMESTGVYWVHLYTVLLEYGFEVYLVNAYHVKNVPGRKSDVSDARWLQQLHTFGLLRGCFQPDNLTRALRNYVRQRKTIITDISIQTQRAQKALEQMNIKLNNVIRDINGVSGRRIITKIIEGERNPQVLAEFADKRIRASKQDIIKSLEGNWLSEQLFNLKQANNHLLFLEQQLLECDKQSEAIIAKFPKQEKHELSIRSKKKHEPVFNVKQYLFEIHGVDVMEIYGFKSTSALTVFSETGMDLKKMFPTEKQFLSWLNVVPDNKITGGKVISSRVKRKKNKAGQAFRDAANALWKAQNPLGDHLRRKKAKSGSKPAIVSTARKLAAIYYKMVTDKITFNPVFLENKSKEYLKNKLLLLDKMRLKVENQLAGIHEFDEVVI